MIGWCKNNEDFFFLIDMLSSLTAQYKSKWTLIGYNQRLRHPVHKIHCTHVIWNLSNILIQLIIFVLIPVT